MPKQRAQQPSPVQYKDKGLSAFRKKDYAVAIQHWSVPELASEAPVRAALAEAHFRLGCQLRHDLDVSLSHFNRAATLAPEDPRPLYHLGLALHRANRLAEARAAYARVAALPAPPAGLGQVRALLALELDPAQPLADLPGLSAEQREALEPVAALLRNDPGAVLTSKPPAWWQQLTTFGRAGHAPMLWLGLAQLATGAPDKARGTLTELHSRHLRSGAQSVCGFYAGLAAAAAGQLETAQAEWEAQAREAQRSNLPLLPSLSRALLANRQAAWPTLITAGDWQQLLTQAQALAPLAPEEAAPVAAQLIAHHRLAQAAAAAGAQAAAIPHWQAMRGLLEARPDLGPLGPVLRNLAGAHEALEQWEAAAEAWAAALKALPKRTGRKTAAHAEHEDLRTWLRSRVLEDYKRANRPDAAIALYRQAVKASPDDLDLRLELAQALLSNEQEIAARNEARRILERQPTHLPAHLLLAEIHHARGEQSQAEALLRASLKIDPQHAGARQGLAQMLRLRGNEWFNTGRYAQARATYLEALALMPGDAQLLVWLAEIAEVQRQPAEVRAHLEAARATGKPEALGLIFQFWARGRNEAEARAILAQAEAAGAMLPDFYIDMGAACLRAAAPRQNLFDPVGAPAKTSPSDKHWDSWGRELIERGLRDHPLPAGALHNLIGRLVEDHQYGPAAEYGRRLLTLTPDDPEQLLAVAIVHIMSQDKAKAKELLKRAEKAARQANRQDLLPEISNAKHMLDNPLYNMLGPSIFALDPDDLEDLF